MAKGTRRLRAAETAPISALEAWLAPIWTYPPFIDIPTRDTLIGGLVIRVAVFGSQRFGRNPTCQRH